MSRRHAAKVSWPGERQLVFFVMFKFENHDGAVIELMGLATNHRDPISDKIQVVVPLIEKHAWMNDNPEAKETLIKFRTTAPDAQFMYVLVDDETIVDRLHDGQAEAILKELNEAMHRQNAELRRESLSLMGDDSTIGSFRFDTRIYGASPMEEAIKRMISLKGIQK